MKEKIMSDTTEQMRLIIDRLHELQETDNMDNAQFQKLMILARDGLVPEEEVNMVRTAMRTMMSDRLPTPQQRDVLLNMLGTLTDIITSDMGMYGRIKNRIQSQDSDQEEETDK